MTAKLFWITRSELNNLRLRLSNNQTYSIVAWYNTPTLGVYVYTKETQ